MGEFCDCSMEMMFDTSACRAQNSQKDCSGRGTCSCGQCSCYHRNNPYEVSFTSFHLNQAIFILVFMRWLINTLYIISLTIHKPNFSNPQKNETRNYGILDLYIFHLFRFFCVFDINSNFNNFKKDYCPIKIEKGSLFNLFRLLSLWKKSRDLCLFLDQKILVF